MNLRIEVIVAILAITCFHGCGGPTPVVGGTPGKVHSGGVPVSDVEVRAYCLVEGTWSELGAGISGADGTFRLIKTGAKGPLALDAGEYRFTLASVGPDPVVFPAEYGDPTTTPLTHTWASGSGAELELLVPVPREGVPQVAPAPGANLNHETSVGAI